MRQSSRAGQGRAELQRVLLLLLLSGKASVGLDLTPFLPPVCEILTKALRRLDI